ncbi:RICIN domain-containing protein [Kitasatospora sp. NBC_01246]|uniref:RICIN domain-containing protein n=1 Tax=Kitasatospora sp. NBC_01246 TaxID=2903570 RepID=UPI002E340F65|nr:RICIN domain-containing protein [Kitasatospora sp. NBC_01246]
MNNHVLAKRRLGSAATAVALGLGAGLLAAAPASASGMSYVPLSADSAVALQNAETGKCLGVVDFRTDDGAPVRQSSWCSDTAQQWRISDGFLVNVYSGKCLEVPGWSTDRGTAVDQWTCNGGANQRWGKVNVNGTTSAVVNFNSGLVLDVSGGDPSDTTPVIQWSPGGPAKTNQQWALNPVG